MVNSLFTCMFVYLHVIYIEALLYIDLSAVYVCDYSLLFVCFFFVYTDLTLTSLWLRASVNCLHCNCLLIIMINMVLHRLTHLNKTLPLCTVCCKFDALLKHHIMLAKHKCFQLFDRLHYVTNVLVCFENV